MRGPDAESESSGFVQRILTTFSQHPQRQPSGAIITEKVFNWPGAGHIHIDSLAARDYPVLMGFTLFLAVLTILGNLIADVLYAWADPRIRLRS